MSPPADTPLLLDEPMTPAHILFSFRGRIPRKTYWLYGVLGLTLFSVVLGALLGIAGAAPSVAGALPSALLLWPMLAIGAKRWHDRDKSSWWLLVNLVPVIGFLWALIENGFLAGTAGPNRYGDDLRGKL